MDTKEIRKLLEKNEQTSLFARLCSWSLKDILNEDLSKEKVFDLFFLTISSVALSSVLTYFCIFVTDNDNTRQI